MDEMAEPRGLAGYLNGEWDGPGGTSVDAGLEEATAAAMRVIPAKHGGEFTADYWRAVARAAIDAGRESANPERLAFLRGEGVLTFGAMREWAMQIGDKGYLSGASGLPDDTQMMVSIAPREAGR
jgi:D-arabinose 1-dehydrogenase-like Zn-dependent alcohol dehydrogenase